MRYLGQAELTRVMGVGYLGEVAQGPDGNLYRWVQGVDGLGNPVGFWRRLRRRLRPFLRVAQQVAPLIPGGAAVTTALRAAAPFVRQAPAATAAMPPAGAAAPEEARTAGWNLGQDELTQVMGIGYLGEVRQGPDGNLYQWIQGTDGLGNPIGFWRRLRRGIRRLARHALPLVQRVASMIPLPQAQILAKGLTVATPLLRRAGLAGYGGLGALYQAPDGTLYQVQGLAEDDDLRGVAEDEELRGLAEDEELQGLAENEELQGLAQDDELRGLAEDDELRGVAEEDEAALRGLAQADELQGFDEGYVRENGVSGLEAYIPEQPAGTRWFVPPAQPPEIWKPLW